MPVGRTLPPRYCRSYSPRWTDGRLAAFLAEFSEGEVSSVPERHWLKVCPQCGTEYSAEARFCETDGTTLRSASGVAGLVGSIIADRYHVLKKLGEGRI